MKEVRWTETAKHTLQETSDFLRKIWNEQINEDFLDQLEYRMKQLLGIGLLLFATACSHLSERNLHRAFNNRSFQWRIIKKDTTINLHLHFFNDSIHITEFEDSGDKYANFGYWKVYKDPGSDDLYLKLDDIFEKAASFKIKSWQNDTLMLSNGDIMYQAIRREVDDNDYANLLPGSWIASEDSIPTSIHEYDKTGKQYTNPTFTFDRDSFKIRTDQFMRKGKYQVLKNSDYVALEMNDAYWQNKVLIIESADSSKLEVRFQHGTTGQWKSFLLERSNAPPMH